MLTLVLKHSDASLIARALGISSSAVDKRLVGARRKLGVTRSIDAALVFARAEGLEDGRTVQVAPFIPVPADAARERMASLEGSAGFWASLLPTRERPFNTLPLWIRNTWVISVLLALTMGVVLITGAMETLSRLYRAG